jgi:hypothetical protein
MSFTINPCKACWEKHKRGECGINSVNSCVTSTAAAFAGIPSSNYLQEAASHNWSECMQKMMAAQGRSPCDFQLHMAPVWNQSPHYFPEILAQTENPEKAKQMCLQQCAELRHNSRACAENCVTDAAAVESYEGNTVHTKAAPRTYQDAAKAHPAVFWIAFAVTGILLAVVLTLFYRVLVGRR